MSKIEKTQETPEGETKKIAFVSFNWSTVISWVVTFLLVTILILVLLEINPFKAGRSTNEVTSDNGQVDVPLPSLAAGLPLDSLIRLANIDTSVPEGVRQFPVKYTVEPGDSIFVIAKKYNITPESILWANYDLLNDDPTFVKEGWRLTIPPTNGVYYEWKEGDTLEKVAEKFYVDPEDIITWPGNHLEVSNPITNNLDHIMIPGGYRDLVSWIKPVEFAARAGATQTIAGAGGCVTPETGYAGSGFFQWPVGSRYLSGFDFTSYHLGIDLAAAEGTPVFAADSGTVVYSGWNDSGYGNLIAIDHNNGYKTIYAHMSVLSVACGDNVTSGTMIGLSGNTGRSTGGHLHFEIRYYSQFINPFQVLP